MPRNRHIYQSDAIFVSNGTITPIATHATGKIFQLFRVQSANYGATLNRVDINQFGQLARIDSLAVESPDVSFDMEYYLHDGYNEAKIGLILDSTFSVGALSGLLVGDTTLNSGAAGVASGRNIFVLSTPEGTDANLPSSYGTGNVSDISAFGNMFLTEYSISAAVGSIPSATVSYEGFGGRVNVDSLGTGRLSAIDASGVETSATFTLPSGQTGQTISVTALRPGDITLTLGNAAMFNDTSSADQGSIHIQSFSISVPLNRTVLQRLGSNFGFAREIDFPVNVDVSINAITAELKTGSVAAALIANAYNDLQITLKNTAGVPKLSFKVKGAQLSAENFASAIGSNKTSDVNFTAQIGGPTDSTAGLFISGSTTALPFS